MTFKVTTLDKFATVQGGYAYKSGDFLPSGKWPVLKIKNIRTESIDYSDVVFVSEQIATATTKWKTKKGDVLISMTGSGPSAPASLVGRVAKIRSGEPVALINQRVGRLVMKDGLNISQSFLYYVLSLKETQNFLVSSSTGSANQVNINAKTIGSVACPDIDLHISTNIANFLEVLDDRIILLHQTNTTLEVIAQTLFKSWFIDFDPVRAKQKKRQPEGIDEVTASFFPDCFEQSEFGEIPKGWHVKKISSIVSESKTRIGNNLATVLSAIQTGNLVRSSDYFNKRIYSKNISKYKAVPPFFFAYNPARINIGSIGINESTELGAVSPVYVVVAPISNYFGYYLWHHLRTGYMKEMIKNMASGSVRQILSYDDFSNINLVIPDENTLKAFFNIRSEIYENIKSNRVMIKTLINIKEILFPKLISGHLRLPDIEEINNQTKVTA